MSATISENRFSHNSAKSLFFKKIIWNSEFAVNLWLNRKTVISGNQAIKFFRIEYIEQKFF